MITAEKSHNAGYDKAIVKDERTENRDFDIMEYQDHLSVELFYPHRDKQPARKLQVGLLDVRAADDIRISYDFDRDGWKIEQQVWQREDDDNVTPKFTNDADEEEEWREAAFIPAWQYEEAKQP